MEEKKLGDGLLLLFMQTCEEHVESKWCVTHTVLMRGGNSNSNSIPVQSAVQSYLIDW